MRLRLGIILLLLSLSELSAHPLKQVKLSLIQGKPKISKMLIRQITYSQLKVNQDILKRYEALANFLIGDYQKSFKILDSIKNPDHIPYICHLQTLVSMYLKKQSLKKWDECRAAGIQKNEGNQVWLDQFVKHSTQPNSVSRILSANSQEIMGILRLQYFQQFFKDLLPSSTNLSSDFQKKEDYQTLLKYAYFQLKKHGPLLENFSEKGNYQDLMLKSQLLLQLKKYTELETLLKAAQKKRNLSEQLSDRLFFVSWKLKKWKQALIYLEMSSLDITTKNFWASFLHTKLANYPMGENSIYMLKKGGISNNSLNMAKNHLYLKTEQGERILPLCTDPNSALCLFTSRKNENTKVIDHFQEYAQLDFKLDKFIKSKMIKEALVIDPEQINLLDQKEP